MRRRTFHSNLHPISIKLMSKGHPWVIQDQYTDLFPTKERFIVALDRRRPFALMFHDPQHKRVKARTWAVKGDFDQMVGNFRKDFKNRLSKAISKRYDKNITDKRQNYYLVFGEADQLPGLFVLYLNGEFLIQYYSYFWEGQQKNIIKFIQDEFFKRTNVDMDSKYFWIQTRADGQSKKNIPKSLDFNTESKNIIIEEFDIKYNVKIGSYYDHGIYTDMASIREKYSSLFSEKKRVLNLYCYTGAFSLFALKQGAEKVTSVDLSQNYLDWLESNLKLNENLDASKHNSMCMPSMDALKELVKNDEKFDLIICDPPSFSSDGNRKTNAMKEYERLIPFINQLLDKDGKALIFLNTHKITRKKFRSKIKDIIDFRRLKNQMKIKEDVQMSQDCPLLNGFPEGDYLKGFLLDKFEHIDNPDFKKKFLNKKTNVYEEDDEDDNAGNRIVEEKQSNAFGNFYQPSFETQTENTLSIGGDQLNESFDYQSSTGNNTGGRGRNNHRRNNNGKKRFSKNYKGKKNNNRNSNNKNTNNRNTNNAPKKTEGKKE